MFFKKKIDFNNIKKIAVIRRNGLGDLLCAYPLIIYLQKEFPHLEITLFVDERNAPLLIFLPKTHEQVIIPKKGNKYGNILRLSLRYFRKFDVAISAKTSPMKLMNFFLFFLQAKQRVAYVNKNWHSWFINQSVLFDASKIKSLHQSIKGIQLIAPEMSKVSSDLLPILTIPQGISQKYVFKLKKQMNFDYQKPILLISGSTTLASNRLEERKYAEFVNELAKEIDLQVVILSEQKDIERSKKISTFLNAPHTIIIPEDFNEFIVLLSICSHFFIGDSGVGHLSSGLKKKCLTLMGKVSPSEWAPMGPLCHILHHPQHVNLIPSDEVLNELFKIFK